MSLSSDGKINLRSAQTVKIWDSVASVCSSDKMRTAVLAEQILAFFVFNCRELGLKTFAKKSTSVCDFFGSFCFSW